MDELRVLICGSVDDGKSTLIGHLLFELDALKTDELERMSPDQKGPDFARLTDGLKAEMEQGITMDVAHRFFQTSTRRFHLLDAPGHEEFTRNMVVGASQADFALILVDAREGKNQQTLNHLNVCMLLGIPYCVVVNKMDAVDYEQDSYERALVGLPLSEDRAIPISALSGNNLSNHATDMHWYSGPTLLEVLETADRTRHDLKARGRFLVQNVLRLKDEKKIDYRELQGIVVAGSFEEGDGVVVFPSATTSRIKSMSYCGEKREEIQAGEAGSLVLDGHLSVSRGDTIAIAGNPLPVIGQKFRVMYANLSGSIELEKDYMVRAGLQKVRGRFHKLGNSTKGFIKSGELTLSSKMAFDKGSRSRDTKSLVFYDLHTNEVVACGTPLTSGLVGDEDGGGWQEYIENQLLSVSEPISEEKSRTDEI